MTGPLTGIRVVDFTIAQQGPHATKLLADMGAEVIKIERNQGRIGGGEPWMRGFLLAHNRNKRSISLDLKHPEGNEVARRLAATADVVASNFRQGVMEKLGLGFEDLRQENPRVVVVQGSGWGPLGPRDTEGAVDMVGHARGGLMWRTGFEGGGPMTIGCAVTDQVGALVLCAAVLGALARAARTGQGEKVDTSLYGGQVALQAWEFAERSLRGGGAQPRAGVGHPLNQRPRRLAGVRGVGGLAGDRVHRSRGDRDALLGGRGRSSPGRGRRGGARGRRLPPRGAAAHAPRRRVGGAPAGRRRRGGAGAALRRHP